MNPPWMGWREELLVLWDMAKVLAAASALVLGCAIFLFAAVAALWFMLA